MVSLKSDDILAHFTEKGKDCLAADDYSGALKHLKTGETRARAVNADRDPALLKVLSLMGDAHVGLGSYAEAAACYLEALAGYTGIDVMHPPGKAGDHDVQRAVTLQRRRRHGPGSPGSVRSFGRTSRAGTESPAQSPTGPALSPMVDPSLCTREIVGVYNSLAYCCYRKGTGLPALAVARYTSLKLAAECYDLLIAETTDRDEVVAALQSKGGVLMKMGRWDEAIDVLKRALDTTDSDGPDTAALDNIRQQILTAQARRETLVQARAKGSVMHFMRKVRKRQAGIEVSFNLGVEEAPVVRGPPLVPPGVTRQEHLERQLEVYSACMKNAAEKAEYSMERQRLYTQAEGVVRQMLEHPADDPERQLYMFSLATVLGLQRRYADGIPVLEEALRLAGGAGDEGEAGRAKLAKVLEEMRASAGEMRTKRAAGAISNAWRRVQKRLRAAGEEGAGRCAVEAGEESARGNLAAAEEAAKGVLAAADTPKLKSDTELVAEAARRTLEELDTAAADAGAGQDTDGGGDTATAAAEHPTPAEEKSEGQAVAEAVGAEGRAEAGAVAAREAEERAAREAEAAGQAAQAEAARKAEEDIAVEEEAAAERRAAELATEAEAARTAEEADAARKAAAAEAEEQKAAQEAEAARQGAEDEDRAADVAAEAEAARRAEEAKAAQEAQTAEQAAEAEAARKAEEDRAAEEAAAEQRAAELAAARTAKEEKAAEEDEAEAKHDAQNAEEVHDAETPAAACETDAAAGDGIHDPRDGADTSADVPAGTDLSDVAQDPASGGAEGTTMADGAETGAPACAPEPTGDAEGGAVATDARAVPPKGAAEAVCDNAFSNDDSTEEAAQVVRVEADAVRGAEEVTRAARQANAEAPRNVEEAVDAGRRAETCGDDSAADGGIQPPRNDADAPANTPAATGQVDTAPDPEGKASETGRDDGRLSANAPESAGATKPDAQAVSPTTGSADDAYSDDDYAEEDDHNAANGTEAVVTAGSHRLASCTEEAYKAEGAASDGPTPTAGDVYSEDGYAEQGYSDADSGTDVDVDDEDKESSKVEGTASRNAAPASEEYSDDDYTNDSASRRSSRSSSRRRSSRSGSSSSRSSYSSSPTPVRSPHVGDVVQVAGCRGTGKVVRLMESNGRAQCEVHGARLEGTYEVGKVEVVAPRVAAAKKPAAKPSGPQNRSGRAVGAAKAAPAPRRDTRKAPSPARDEDARRGVQTTHAARGVVAQRSAAATHKADRVPSATTARTTRDRRESGGGVRVRQQQQQQHPQAADTEPLAGDRPKALRKDDAAAGLPPPLPFKSPYAMPLPGTKTRKKPHRKKDADNADADGGADAAAAPPAADTADAKDESQRLPVDAAVHTNDGDDGSHSEYSSDAEAADDVPPSPTSSSGTAPDEPAPSPKAGAARSPYKSGTRELRNIAAATRAGKKHGREPRPHAAAGPEAAAAEPAATPAKAPLPSFARTKRSRDAASRRHLTELEVQKQQRQRRIAAIAKARQEANDMVRGNARQWAEEEEHRSTQRLEEIKQQYVAHQLSEMEAKGEALRLAMIAKEEEEEQRRRMHALSGLGVKTVDPDRPLGELVAGPLRAAAAAASYFLALRRDKAAKAKKQRAIERKLQRETERQEHAVQRLQDANEQALAAMDESARERKARFETLQAEERERRRQRPAKERLSSTAPAPKAAANARNAASTTGDAGAGAASTLPLRPPTNLPPLKRPKAEGGPPERSATEAFEELMAEVDMYCEDVGARRTPRVRPPKIVKRNWDFIAGHSTNKTVLPALRKPQHVCAVKMKPRDMQSDVRQQTAILKEALGTDIVRVDSFGHDDGDVVMRVPDDLPIAAQSSTATLKKGASRRAMKQTSSTMLRRPGSFTAKAMVSPKRGSRKPLDDAEDMRRLSRWVADAAAVGTTIRMADRQISTSVPQSAQGERPVRMPCSQATYAKLINYFEAIDENGNGLLEWEEVQDFAEFSGIRIDRSTFLKMDEDGSGALDFLEMLQCLFPDCTRRDLNCAAARWGLPNSHVTLEESMQTPVWTDVFETDDAREIFDIFQSFQVSSSRYLTFEDLRAHLSGSLSDDIIRSCVDHYGTDGQLSVEQFSKMMSAMYNTPTSGGGRAKP